MTVTSNQRVLFLAAVVVASVSCMAYCQPKAVEPVKSLPAVPDATADKLNYLSDNDRACVDRYEALDLEIENLVTSIDQLIEIQDRKARYEAAAEKYRKLADLLEVRKQLLREAAKHVDDTRTVRYPVMQSKSDATERMLLACEKNIARLGTLEGVLGQRP